MKARASRSPHFGFAGPVCEVMARCHGKEATEAHHRRNRGMGSTRRPDTNEAANGLMCCADDHQWITEHPKEAREFGWIVSQYKTPAEVPVLYRGKWAMLDDQGGLLFVPAPVVKPA
jgi:5-methylcytosine-specific restriction protein A